MSMLFISHDLGLVGEISDRVVVMRSGVVREAGEASDHFFQHPRTATPRPCWPAAPVWTRARAAWP
jgi:peptide/nickel transport system ATP-binding protein